MGNIDNLDSLDNIIKYMLEVRNKGIFDEKF